MINADHAAGVGPNANAQVSFHAPCSTAVPPEGVVHEGGPQLPSPQITANKRCKLIENTSILKAHVVKSRGFLQCLMLFILYRNQPDQTKRHSHRTTANKLAPTPGPFVLLHVLLRYYTTIAITLLLLLRPLPLLCCCYYFYHCYQHCLFCE